MSSQPGICTACTTPQQCRETGWCSAREDDGKCPECGDTGIASGAMTFDCGDGEGEDMPCPRCSS